MQVRHVMISVLFAVTIIAVYDACNARGGGVDSVAGMATRFSIAGLVVIVFWLASLGLQRWMARVVIPIAPKRVRPARPTGPGRFKVLGVDPETRLHITEFVIAESIEHAATKVSLKGVNVEAVEPV